MSTPDEILIITGILETCQHPCIVELGGYHGEDSEWMLKVVKDKDPIAIMVEPDPENIIAIRSLGYSGNLIAGAIADHTGTCDFWACYTEEGRGSGSIRQPTGHLEEKPWYDFRKMGEPIRCYSLDDIFTENELDHIDVLWVDIQGAERDMITGGRKALKHTHYLFIEAEERNLYEGQALRTELLAMLPEWTVIRIFEQNLLLRNNLATDLPSRWISPVAQATGAKCPRCRSRALTLAGGMKHCNQCGYGFV